MNTEDKIKVIRARDEGKRIETVKDCVRHDWREMYDDEDFNFDQYDYRIAEEERLVGYVPEDHRADWYGWVWSDKGARPDSTSILVREVRPGDLTREEIEAKIVEYEGGSAVKYSELRLVLLGEQE